MAIHHLAAASHLQRARDRHEVDLDDLGRLALGLSVDSHAAGEHNVADIVV
jgi:hypothetical protein